MTSAKSTSDLPEEKKEESKESQNEKKGGKPSFASRKNKASRPSVKAKAKKEDEDQVEELVAEAVDEDGGDAVESEKQEDKSSKAEDIEALEEELKETKAELVRTLAIASEAQDQYLRLKAEWDNFRKRNSEQREQEKLLANEKIVTELLPVLDDMERAYLHAEETQDESPLKDGTKVIYDKFLMLLAKFGVEQISPLDQPFDSNIHQAISTQVVPDKQQDTVVGVIQRGYKIGTKVLRPAMVVTSTTE